MFPTNLLAALALLAPPADNHWTQFHGGPRASVAEAKTLPVSWDTKKNVVWKADIPGRGWSSPVVWEDHVYLTTVVSDRQLRNPQKGLYINDLQGTTPTGESRWLVLCLDVRTGKTLWQKEVHKGKAPGTIHLKNSYASATPATDGERVYASFGNVGVFCFSRDGKLLWEKRLPPLKTRFGWGPAASPALYKDRLYIVNDNEEKSYLLALDTRTGREVWRVERDEKSNWTTPYVWVNDKRTEIVTAGTKRVRSYSLDGKLLWELSGMSVISIPSPFAAGGLLYVTSGYVLDFFRPLYAIRPGASGDISLKQGEKSNKYIVWCQGLAGPYHPTPIVYGDYIYVLLDRGFLSCYEAKTGKSVYQKQRINPGSSAFTASPWAGSGKIYCLGEDGDTFVIKAGPKFELLGRNSLDEMTLASPALAGGSLYIRTMGKLYRLQANGQ
jgi:outer membrane protein assembly factor BamB